MTKELMDGGMNNLKMLNNETLTKADKPSHCCMIMLYGDIGLSLVKFRIEGLHFKLHCGD